jgi:hypothetical protein
MENNKIPYLNLKNSLRALFLLVSVFIFWIFLARSENTWDTRDFIGNNLYVITAIVFYTIIIVLAWIFVLLIRGYLKKINHHQS